MPGIAAARARGRPHETPIDRMIGNYRRSNKGIVSKAVNGEVRADLSSIGNVSETPAKLSGITSHTLTEPHWPRRQQYRVGRGIVTNLPPCPHACLRSARWNRCYSDSTMLTTQAVRGDDSGRNKIRGQTGRFFVTPTGHDGRTSDVRRRSS